MTIVHAQIGETLEYFIEVNSEIGLTFDILTDFLIKELKKAPTYLESFISDGLLALNKIQNSDHPLTPVGATCQGLSRHVMMKKNNKLYSVQLSVIHVHHLSKE